MKKAGNRWYKYDSNGNVIFEKDLPEGMTLEDDENTVVMSRVQKLREDVYAIDEGWGLFASDSASGSGSRGSKKNGGRTYTWNERNQLVASVDDSRSTSYVYDYNGVRTNKYSRGMETLYFNQFYSMRFDAGVGYGNGQVVKHIYLGDTRIVTKLGSVKNSSYSEEYHKQYFYHSDHLGSASLISDFEGREYQRIEYTPYGETWVEKSQNTGMEYLPYKFTGKERDEETGLYYYGARYLDPQYSRWLSTDPALGDYVPQVGGDNSKLPGQCGLFNTVNFHLYHYAGNNPVKYVDPDGRTIDDVPSDTQQSAGKGEDAPTLGDSSIKIYDQGCTLTQFYRMAKRLGYTGSLAEANQVALDNKLFTFSAEDNANTLLTPENGAALVTALCAKDGYTVMYDSSAYGSVTDMAKAINEKEYSPKNYFATARLNSGHSVNINGKSVIANNVSDMSNALAFKYNDTSSKGRVDSNADTPNRVDFFRVIRDNWVVRRR